MKRFQFRMDYFANLPRHSLKFLVLSLLIVFSNLATAADPKGSPEVEMEELTQVSIPGTREDGFLYTERVHIDYWSSVLSTSHTPKAHIRARKRAPKILGRLAVLELKDGTQVKMMIQGIDVEAMGLVNGKILAFWGNLLDSDGRYINFEGNHIARSQRQANEISIWAIRVQKVSFPSSARLPRGIIKNCKDLF